MPQRSTTLLPSVRSVRWTVAEKEDARKSVVDTLRTSPSMESTTIPSDSSSSEVDLVDYDVAPLEDQEEIMKIVRKSVYELPPDYQQKLLSHWETVNREQFYFYNKTQMESMISVHTPRRSTLTAELPSEVSDLFRAKQSVLSIKSSVMTIASDYLLKASGSRFRNVKPEFVEKRLQMRTNYEFVRNMAVRKLTRNVRHNLTFIRKTTTCYSDQINKDASYDHKRVFSWDDAHFYSRRSLQGTVWVEILLNEFSPSCLNLLKFRRDVEEIQRLMNMMFLACDKDTQDEKIVESAVKCMERAHAFLNIYEDIEKQYAEHMELLSEKINKITDADASRLSEDRMQAKILYHEKIMNYAVTLPVKFRYQMKRNEAHVENHKIEADTKATKLEDIIKDYKSKIKVETYCFQCIMNTRYTEIENLKERIHFLSGKYETDHLKVENSNQYIKNNLVKLRNRRSSLTQELESLRHHVKDLHTTEKKNEEPIAESIEKRKKQVSRRHRHESHRWKRSARGVL